MRALVVDDDAMNRELLRRMMLAVGWSVDDAQSGMLAIEACNRVRYDLVLVDLMMPLLDGYETAVAIRVGYGREHHDVVIIVVTGSDELDVKASTVFDGILAKPFLPDELNACISVAMENHIADKPVC